MHRRTKHLAFCIAFFATSVAAQTTNVQNSNNGVSGQVPVYSGSATLGSGSSSPITVSSGNVGIGTTSPSQALEINNSQAANILLRMNPTANITQGARFLTGAYTGNPVTAIYAYSVSGTNLLYIGGGTNEAEPSSIIRFITGPAGTIGAGNNVMEINSSGYVGIGTLSPAGIFDVEGGTAAASTNGTPVKVVAQNGGTGNQNGGNIILTPGTATGTGAAGNVGIGTTSPGAKLEVDGNVKLTSGSGGSITFQDGTVQSTAYTGVTCGGDYAESVDVTGNRIHYEPGDLLVIDPSTPGKFLKSAEAYSTLVAGIYSTKPGTVGRRQTTSRSPDEIPMAMMGIVPTKVSAQNGPIKTGDLLVTSSTLGYAMKGTDRSRLTGAVVGKALGSLETGTGVIEVLVTLQ